MDASSRDNRTTAIHESVTCKSKNLLFADRKEQDLTSFDLGWKNYHILPVSCRLCRVLPLTKAEYIQLLVVFTCHSST
jgi:hypothetical protein